MMDRLRIHLSEPDLSLERKDAAAAEICSNKRGLSCVNNEVIAVGSNLRVSFAVAVSEGPPLHSNGTLFAKVRTVCAQFTLQINFIPS